MDLNPSQFTDLSIDSRDCKPGVLFFAVEGTQRDAHDHLEQAIQNGATGLVVSKPERVPKAFKGEVLVVENVRDELAQICSKFFGHPDQKMKLIGVTGTNGKTTSVYMLEHLLNSNQTPTAVLGTIDHHFHDQVWATQLTTPDILSLYRRLTQVLNLGAKAVAMEISSHALDQKWVRGLNLDVGIWTNLTRDHLDYHGTEEQYFRAKNIMFEENLSQKKGFGLLNGDDAKLKKVSVNGGKTYRFGQGKVDFKFKVLEKKLSHSKFHLETPLGAADFFLPTPGLHNVYNATGAIATALLLGLKMENLQQSLTSFYGAAGRLERIANDRGLNVFVDYAHTPDAIRSSLESLRDLLKEHPQNRLWVVFGFGGDRDKGKRPLMVEQALKLADQLVLTSDNPRFEDPKAIVEDGLVVVPKDVLDRSVHVVLDRAKAISFALQSAKENDVILIAGKGHETYQIVGDKVLPFSDKAAVLETLK